MGAPSEAFVRQYSDAIALLSQQVENRLSGTVMVDTNWIGEKKNYNQYAAEDMEELTSRYQDTPIQATDHRTRVVTPRYFVSNTLEDPQDALAMLVDPKSTYMQSKKASANRKIDDVIISAFGSTAYTGKNGDVAQAFLAGNQIAHGSAGMTKAKVLSAKQHLDSFEVDKQDRFATHSSKQMEDLLGLTEVTSSDFNVVKALVEGDIDTWVGFKWIHTERLLDDGASHRLCYFYQKKAMQLAIQKEPMGRVDERPDKNYAWQVYMCLALGSTRLEEEAIVEVSCLES